MFSSTRSIVIAAIFASLIVAAPGLAQETPTCGSEATPGDYQLDAELEAMGAYELPGAAAAGVSGELVVPLALHVVGDDNGVYGVTQTQLDQAIDDANIAFEGTGITFCMFDPIDYINSSTYNFTIVTILKILELRAVNVVPEAINVYLTTNLAIETGSIDGISSFTGSNDQGIVIRKSHFGRSTDPSTFPHELGHYFNLFHTHVDNPIVDPLECVTRIPPIANCETTADRLCDTPADPGLSVFSVSSYPLCGRSGNRIPAPCPDDDDYYEPDFHNYMSYSRRLCRDHWYDEQKAKMLATLINLRPELRNAPCNNFVYPVPTSDFPSIQAGIDAAVSDGRVIVAPGTYYEAINFNGKAITVRSSGGPDVTIIDGTGLNDSVVKCISGEGPETILEGFTITGGTGDTVTWGPRIGGGMLNESSSPMVTNCTFSGNSAVFGGGMCNRLFSSPTVTNCTFSSNWANFYGSGMYNFDNSSPTVTNCAFRSNLGTLWGGGMSNEKDCSPAVTNCMFSGNSAREGGGMFNDFNSSPTVTNCTFGGNAANYGGGMYNGFNSSPTVTNCILWGNGPDQIFNQFPSSTPIVSFSDVQGGLGTGTVDGGDNIDDDPLFADAQGDNLRVAAGSPCIDAGDSTAVPADTLDLDLDADTDEPTPFDLDGYNRIFLVTLDIVDMGAYENRILEVDGATGETIQEAINIAPDDAVVVVAPGTYYEAINFNGKAITVRSSGGPDVTIIDGTGLNDSVVKCISGEGPDTVLEGFTITGGTGTACHGVLCGGGMYSDQSDPTVINCIFSGNSADVGGGIFTEDSDPTVTNCIFSGNSALYGGGMYSDQSDPTVTNCTFSGNSANFGGGMVNDNGSSPTVTNCILWGNGPDQIFNFAATPIVSFSDVQGGLGTGTVDGGDNIDDDPLFVDAVGDNLRLAAGSPCIDKGDTTAVPADTMDLDLDADTDEPIPFDLDGNDRFFNAVVDLGAYEFRDLRVQDLVVFYAGKYLVCRGGSNDGSPCTLDTDCPGGACVELADPTYDFLGVGSTATVGNITNYIEGITGIRVTFNDVVQFATTAADAFAFEWTGIGGLACDGGSNNGSTCFVNSECPGGVCGETFPPVTDAGTAITVTHSVLDGVTVVKIVLTDDHVRRRWLKITIDSAKVSANGVALDGELVGNPVMLPSGDGFPNGNAVFFLGNMPGDVTGDRKNTLTDVGATRLQANPVFNVPIENIYDVDKSGKVQLADVGAVRLDANPLLRLRLISP